MKENWKMSKIYAVFAAAVASIYEVQAMNVAAKTTEAVVPNIAVYFFIFQTNIELRMFDTEIISFVLFCRY